MGAPRYSQAAKEKALSALATSAVLVGDELIPNFHAVERQIGIPDGTLHRWWKARDASKDKELRDAVSRACEVAREQGAATWLERQVEGMRGVIEYALDERHRTIGVVEVDGERVTSAPIRPDHLVRAAQSVAIVIREMDSLLQGQGQTAVKDRGQRLRRLQEAVARTTGKGGGE